MTRQSGGPTINRGPAPRKDRDEVGEVAGNAERKGEDASPDDRERGETSSADSAAAVDSTVHDRAS